MTTPDTPAAQAAAGDVWRVVLADGDVGVCVPRDCEDGSWSAVVRWPGGAMSRADGADAGQAVWRAAVERCEWLYGRDDVAAYVVEVLAPGESPRAELTADLARLRAPLPGDLAAIEARAAEYESAAQAYGASEGGARERWEYAAHESAADVPTLLRHIAAQQAAHAAALDGAVAAARAEALREAERVCKVVALELSYDFRLRQGMHGADRCAAAVAALAAPRGR